MFGLIYKISNNINDKVYIGQTTETIRKRFMKHKSDKRGNCPKLFHAFNKYGRCNFKIDLIVSVNTPELLNFWEKFYIIEHNSIGNGYNIKEGGKSGKYRHTEESKRKIGIANAKSLKGKKLSEEHKRNISNGLKGKIVSEATRKKISESNKGRVSPRKGQTLSAETKAKLSKSLKGNTNSKGRKLSASHKKKLSNAHKGKTLSKKHKENLSKAHKMFSKKQELDICKKYKKLNSTSKVAELFNCSGKTILKIVKRYNIPTTKTQCITKNQELVICDKYESGESLESISQYFNCYSALIKNILKKHDIKITSKKFKEEQEAIICDQYSEEGVTLKMLALQYDCSDSTIKGVLIRNGSKVKGKLNKFTTKKEREIYITYQQLKSSIKTARLFGCTAPTVLAIITRVGGLYGKD